jgi:hypothetical protein
MQVPFPEYILPPLAGLSICGTGYAHIDRQKMEQMITQLGGVFTPDLIIKVTHLLVAARALNTPKYL